MRRWAVALASAAALVGCGGGSGDTSLTPQTTPLVSQLDGRVQPAEADQGVSGLKSRSAAALPTPAKVRLGALANEKALSLASVQGRQQIGVARDVTGTQSAAQTQQQLQWKRTSTGSQVAAISFSAEGAYGLRLGVVVKQIAGSAQLRVYRQADVGNAFQISGQELLQHIERNAAGGDKTLEGQTWWTPDLGGDEVTLEIELPAGTAVSTLDVSVPRVSHVFEDISTRSEESISTKINESSSCQLDASCYETYVNQRNAVARMIFVSGGGSYLCTGTLLNNTQSSGVPYFLTANHCISTQTEASSLQTDWFYRAPACNSRTLSASTTRRVGGAQLLYASSSNDMTLLRLNDTPPAGAYFAGWDASTQALGQSVVGLHHPAGDLLKASFGTLSSQATCSSQSGDILCGGTSGNFYQVNWNQGTTQGGSSGSAIFKNGTQVIGTLYAGSASCTNATSPDFYGRFDVGFNAALKNWLAPAVSTGSRTAVYRFYNATTGAHFFTASAEERNSIVTTLPLFAYEGVAFYVYGSSGSGLSPVYRFFNTQGGTHFYTISATERDSVQANLPAYSFEGTGWYAQTANDGSATPIYRFYRQSSKTHFYTVSSTERDSLIAGNADYRYEGPAYYVWNGL
jgi:lysyl endopeptidase